jgi:hypothetical protein
MPGEDYPSAPDLDDSAVRKFASEKSPLYERGKFEICGIVS